MVIVTFFPLQTNGISSTIFLLLFFFTSLKVGGGGHIETKITIRKTRSKDKEAQNGIRSPRPPMR